MPTLCAGSAGQPCNRGPGGTPRKAGPGSQPPRCAGCQALLGTDGRGGNRFCSVVDCKDVACQDEMGATTADPLTCLTQVLEGTNKYCAQHARMVWADLQYPGSMRNAADKILAFSNQHGQFNCVRTYGRPGNLSTRTAKFLKRCRVPWLTFICHSDPTFSQHLRFYVKRPHLCILGPPGGAEIVRFMLEAAMAARLPEHTQLFVMDDNIYTLQTLSGGRLRPMRGTLMRMLISRGAMLLRDGQRKAWSVRPHANSMLATNFGKASFPDTQCHAARSAEAVFRVSEGPSLLYTAVLGMRIDMAFALLPVFGSGQDDVERTVRFLMHGERITIFKHIFTRKPHYEPGGLACCYQGKEDRMRAHRQQHQRILEWAWARVRCNSDRRRWADVKTFFMRFKDFRASLELFCASVPGA